MASAEREPITGVWGQCPQWGVQGSLKFDQLCACRAELQCKANIFLIKLKIRNQSINQILTAKIAIAIEVHHNIIIIII